jgi:hypothetical protein
VQHLEKPHGRAHLVALLAAALAFLATMVAATLLLPGQVNVYYTPTDRSDVVVERWQYLTLMVIGTTVVAAVLATLTTTVLGLVAAFTNGTQTTDPRAAAWTGAWVLLWLSAAVWLAIWLGNDSPERRSWFELLLSLAGLAGVVLVIAWRARRQRSR